MHFMYETVGGPFFVNNHRYIMSNKLIYIGQLFHTTYTCTITLLSTVFHQLNQGQLMVHRFSFCYICLCAGRGNRFINDVICLLPVSITKRSHRSRWHMHSFCSISIWYKLPRLCLCKMRVLKYYVKTKHYLRHEKTVKKIRHHHTVASILKRNQKQWKSCPPLCQTYKPTTNSNSI